MSRDTSLGNGASSATPVALRHPAATMAARLERFVAPVTSWIGQPFARRWPIRRPLLALLLLTALFRWTPIDTVISSQFYDPQTREWHWFFHTGCTLFYRGGIYPAIVLFIAGILLALTGRLCGCKHKHRAGLFLVFLFIIGPGMIVNHGLKNHWGRPRPHQLEQFGGAHPFVPVGSPGPLMQANSSFPSGHAAVAFYLMGPGFLASPRRRGLSTRLIIGGMLFGGLMALVRVVQGGHFVSDVVWSGAIVYFTAVILARIILHPRDALQGASHVAIPEVPAALMKSAA